MPTPSTTVFPSSGIFPGLDEIPLPIGWDEHDDRYFHHGTDRGVLYPRTGNAVAWNGITGVDEASDSSTSVLYRDGVIYYSAVEPGDFQGKLTAYFYPDAFAACAGIPEATDGLFVDNQRPKPFNLSYRSLIGSGMTGDVFGYQIHLIYNATAQLGTRTRKTIGEDNDIMELSFDLVCTPVPLPGMRPSAHYIIDTRYLDQTTIDQLEAILYGDGEFGARLPTPTELYDLMNFGSSFQIIDKGDGVFTIRGSYQNFEDLGDDKWRIKNINGTDNLDGTVTLTDTP
jgi:hypothetical protein